MANPFFDWFDIVTGAITSVIVIVLLWAPLPRRIRDSIWIREQPLSTRLLYLAGTECMSFAIVLGGITGWNGVDWWWWLWLPWYLGLFMMLRGISVRIRRSRATRNASAASAPPSEE